MFKNMVEKSILPREKHNNPYRREGNTTSNQRLRYLEIHGVKLHTKWIQMGVYDIQYMGVSKNNGTPKWMVYNGKPY